ncbi:MAG: hypothetical protein J3T61_02015 [Candidatus Brocadiales bacterium]|nr:hypothetical protein [Candidatus Bathyanammoxibius sp.]
MKKSLYLGLMLLLFISVNTVSCERAEEEPEEETMVALREEEEEFFGEKIPALEEWAEQEWEERAPVEEEEGEEPVELETPGGLKEAMAATSRAMRRLSRSVKKDNWEGIKDSGKQVEDLIAGRCVTLYFKQHPSGVPTEFIIIGDRFRAAIQSLVRGAKGRNSNDVLREFFVVKGTCKDCHKLFKEKDDEE